MRKHHPKNERIKRAYLAYLEEAKRCSIKTTDQVAAAIALFEASTRWKDFAAFHVEQARAFKRSQYDAVNPETGKPLAKATVHSRLMHLKAFFHWLAGQPGYKSRISYSDSDYFNPSANDTRIATAKRERPAPTLEQIGHVLKAMPARTLIEKRNRALVAFTILTGARDDALASMSCKHVDLTAGKVEQDARDVRTKNRKTFTTWFFPVGDEPRTIVEDWLETLKTECLFGPDDPLFPATEMGLVNGKFAATGLSRSHWSNAGPIRRIFRDAFTLAGLPYFNPHSFRKTLARLGEERCSGKSPEAFKAWSQNLGHEQVLTTFMSYGTVASNRQAEIMRSFGKTTSNESPLDTELNPDEIARLKILLRETRN
ncbi:MAG: recombinase XerC [Phyllobacteriaceae bacterium]|nr:recombinase XerC [Phyllobacteriaceae bacterium]MBA93424.1 recombinase XerC [Phyllobacteriaceae bacterium]